MCLNSIATSFQLTKGSNLMLLGVAHFGSLAKPEV
jgi:hypothetical protein